MIGHGRLTEEVARYLAVIIAQAFAAVTSTSHIVQHGHGAAVGRITAAAAIARTAGTKTQRNPVTWCNFGDR